MVREKEKERPAGEIRLPSLILESDLKSLEAEKEIRSSGGLVFEKKQLPQDNYGRNLGRNERPGLVLNKVIPYLVFSALADLGHMDNLLTSRKYLFPKDPDSAYYVESRYGSEVIFYPGDQDGFLTENEYNEALSQIKDPNYGLPLYVALRLCNYKELNFDGAFFVSRRRNNKYKFIFDPDFIVQNLESKFDLKDLLKECFNDSGSIEKVETILKELKEGKFLPTMKARILELFKVQDKSLIEKIIDRRLAEGHKGLEFEINQIKKLIKEREQTILRMDRIKKKIKSLGLKKPQKVTEIAKLSVLNHLFVEVIKCLNECSTDSDLIKKLENIKSNFEKYSETNIPGNIQEFIDRLNRSEDGEGDITEDQDDLNDLREEIREGLVAMEYFCRKIDEFD
ncbi:MAG: hypothetical protein GF347_03255 [Candidatus Moranbacteria bacterium]|nr:hypothetical protein [Candidatus Moranbacteria bacterium]